LSRSKTKKVRKHTLKYKDNISTVYLQDANDFSNNIRDNSIDLLICSPPYFIGKEYDSSKSVTDFKNQHKSLLSILVNKIKIGGSLCWQVGYHANDAEIVPLDFIIFEAAQNYQCLTLRNRIVWTFAHGVHSRKRFSGRHETIMWFTKGDSYYFDLDAVRTPQKYPGKRYYMDFQVEMMESFFRCVH